MHGTLAPLTVLVIFCAAPVTALADWTLGAAASVSHDDNVGNAQNYDDKVSDYAATANISLFQLIPLGDFSLSVGGDLAGEAYDRLTGLNNASIDASVSLKKKWGLGAFAPWARAQLSLGRADYQDVYRDATIARASLELGKRLDERLNLTVKYFFERRAATAGEELLPGLSSDVFSQNGHNFLANAEYALSERISLNLGTLLRHGDVVSTTLSPGYGIYESSSAVADDPTFGPNAYAYKLTGTTYGVRLGAEFSVTVHSSIGLGFQRLETHAQGGNNYSNSMPEVTWNYRL
jgi:hypothetical protein